MSFAIRTRPVAPRMRSLTLHDLSTVFDLNVVLIPDFSTKAPRVTLDTFWAGLSPVLSVDHRTVRPFVVGFEYGGDKTFESIWHFLSLQGDALLDCIMRQFGEIQLLRRPLLFICQGLGGLILKKAMTILYDQYLQPARRWIREAHAGIVFLGTPHPTYARRNEWFKLTLVLQSLLKLSDIQLSQAEVEAALVAGISRRFEESNIDVRILSVCETKRTKISRGLFDSTKHILVDKDFAKTSLLYEELIEVEADHYEIGSCKEGSKTFGAIRDLVRTAQVPQIDTAGSTPSQDESIPGEVNDDMVESTAGSVFFLELGPEVQESNEAVLNTTDRSSEELLPTLVDLVVQDKTLPIPCYILKGVSQNHHFFGRKDILDNVDKALLPEQPPAQGNSQYSSDNLRAFAICGLGGVGKTQIAIEYAFSRRDQYDAIFWVEADENTKLADGFGQIATQLGFNDASDTDRVISRNVVLEWLSTPKIRPVSSSVSGTPDSQPREASWLIIFNNVDDLELLGSYWPIGGAGSILLTSRDPLAKKDRLGVDLESFPTLEAAEFLRRKLDLDDSPANVADSIALAERFGGLPLAISQIAALVERWEMTMEEFLEFYDKETSKIAVTKDNPAFLRDNYYKHSLFTVWAFDSLSPTALLILQIVSFLNPDAIQEFLFTNCKAESLPKHFPTADVNYVKARSELTKVSLVKRVKENSVITLHRLVQDVVQAHMPTSLAIERFSFTVNMVLKAWPTGFLQFDHETVTWEKSEELLQHILKLRNAAENHTSWKLPLQVTMDFAKLLLFAGWYLYERSDFFSARPLFNHVLKLCRSNPGDEMLEILADTLFTLSAISGQTNYQKQQMMAYAQEHFDIRKRLRDGSQFAEDRFGMAHGELGQVCMLSGLYEESIENCHIAIEITIKSPRFKSGEDWPTWANCHQAFALSALGRYTEGMKLMRATEHYHLSRFDHQERWSFHLGLTYRCVGYLQAKLGNPLESFEANKLALKHFKNTVGTNTRYTSQACSNLGAYHFQLGQCETARIYFHQALAGFRAHPWYAPELARTLYRFSQLQEFEGNETGASISLAKAIKLYKTITPTHDESKPLTATDFEEIVPIPHR